MKKYILMFCLLLVYSIVLSQEEKKNPKVGLVLSGGGAKGLAHIGVLKVIEESGVQIDYIGGTSMGAIVGGLYASGYSANQIDSIFQVTDFEKIIQDNLPRSVKSFYEKDNDERYALTLPFDKFKIGIPLALSKGQNVYNLLNRLTYRVNDISDFNEFPIPFLCIATDIETGKQVVLDKGYLPQAIKASGAFPSLFSPVEIEGKFLIDGGVVNNYPLDEIKALGADIIIGVDVQDDLKTKETMSSAASVVMQIINFQMYQGMDIKAKATDIYIKPDIKGYNVISFDSGEKIIKNGEAAARVFKDQLVELGNSQIKEKRNFDYPANKDLCINQIIIKGNENYSRAYILGKMRLSSNQSISFKDLDDGLNSLNATQNFKKIDYQLSRTEHGENLILDLTENKVKTFLKLGVHYDGLYKTAALINLTQKNLLFENDVSSLDLILGDNLRYNLDYYIDNGFYWSFGFNSRFNRFKSDFPVFGEEIPGRINDLNKVNIRYSDFTNQIYLQTIFRQVFSVGVGIQHKFLKVETETFNTNEGTGGAIFENNNYLSSYAYLRYDTYDNKYFPHKGISFNGNFQWYLLSSEKGNMFSEKFSKFSVVQGDLGIAQNLFKNFTFRIKTEGGFSLGDSPQVLNFFLGGYGFNAINNFKSFYGYDYLTLKGNSYIKGTVGLDYEIVKNNHLNFYANYANIGDDIYENIKEWFSSPDYSGYAVGYGLETLLGPVEVKYSWSPETRSSYWLFTVGFWF